MNHSVFALVISLVCCCPVLAAAPDSGSPSSDATSIWLTVTGEQISQDSKVNTAEIDGGLVLDINGYKDILMYSWTPRSLALESEPRLVASAPKPTWSFRARRSPVFNLHHTEAPHVARDNIIFEGPLIGMSGGVRFIADDTTVASMSLSFEDNFPPQDVFLFAGVELGHEDIGTVRIATSATEPDFDAAVESLTNGNRGYITHFFFLSHGDISSSSGSATWESFYFGSGPGVNGIDLEGFAIESIAVRIDDFSLDTPGRDPNGDGIWTDYSLDWTLIIRGPSNVVEIPTISTFSMLIFLATLALCGVVLLSRRSARACEPRQR